MSLAYCSNLSEREENPRLGYVQRVEEEANVFEVGRGDSFD